MGITSEFPVGLENTDRDLIRPWKPAQPTVLAPDAGVIGMIASVLPSGHSGSGCAIATLGCEVPRQG
jgi:hypothetical protein